MAARSSTELLLGPQRGFEHSDGLCADASLLYNLTLNKSKNVQIKTWEAPEVNRKIDTKQQREQKVSAPHTLYTPQQQFSLHALRYIQEEDNEDDHDTRLEALVCALDTLLNNEEPSVSV